jgi:predicted AAA+ superfamily ATPase
MNVWFQGGFPEPLIESKKNPVFHLQWIENYIMNYVGRDIRMLFPRLNIHTFRRFLTLLAQHSGHQLNMSNMARSIEVSVSTIKDYLDIIHQTFLWRNLAPFTKNSLKKVQKSKKGFFRDQGLLHYFLKINDLDSLLIHPVAGFSFESFVIEEIIRGLQTTMTTELEFYYYRTIDKSEVDLVIDGRFGLIPIEIKLNSTVNQAALRGLKNFLNDTNAKYAILINRGKRIELLADNIIQIPVNYI